MVVVVFFTRARKTAEVFAHLENKHTRNMPVANELVLLIKIF